MDRQVWGKVGESGSAFGKSSRMTSMGYIPMQDESPSPDHVAQEEGTWLIPPEKLEELYQRDLTKYVDPETKHYWKHIALNEDEKAIEALKVLEIIEAEIREKYNKGSTVLVTETGTCYHVDANCTALANSVSVKEINKSEGLKNHTACSQCVR